MKHTVLDNFPNLIVDSNNIWHPIDSHGQKISYPEDASTQLSTIEDDSFWFTHRNRCIHKLVSKFSPQSQLWDIGGGNGCVSAFLISKGIDVTLIEPGINGANYAKRNRKIENVICASTNDLNCSLKIDSIGLFDVIEHIEDDIDFIRKIEALLKPGGYLYITVPSFIWLWSNSDVYAQHYRRYTIKTISLLLENFEIKYSSYFFQVLTLPIFLLRSIPYLLRLKTVENPDSDHGTSDGILTKIIKYFLDIEKNAIGNKKFSFGSSCIIVAKLKK